jgi:hypothetical protein
MLSFLICSVALGLWAGDAEACGGIAVKIGSDEVTTISDLRLLLVREQNRIVQYVQVAYTGKAKEFAWIYPVAANPEVEEVSASPFDELEARTRPTVEIFEPETSQGMGCAGGCLAGDGAVGVDPRQDVGDVKVWQKGQVGAFDYVVISATKASDLTVWLSDNGFSTAPTMEPLFGHYVGLGWYFVAMKVSVENVETYVPSMTVVRFEYTANELRYPLKMVALSASAETSLTLYLINRGSGESLAAKTPFVTTMIPAGKLQATARDQSNYEELFDELLAEGAGRALVNEYTYRYDADYGRVDSDVLKTGDVLIRYRTRFPASSLDQDIVFEPTSYQPVWNVHKVTYTAPAGSSIPLPLVLAAMALVAIQLGRRLGRKGA